VALVAAINAEIDEGVRRLPGDVTTPTGWPHCGHSACRQNWIDTGAHDVCVHDLED
jgi:hypothetical protein